MARIQHLENLPTLPLPCDYFDLIGGVGTGGCASSELPSSYTLILNVRLIALMLGRLRMPIDTAIKEYVGLTQRVFSKKRFGRTTNVYRANVLEAAMKTLIETAGYPVDSLMRGPDTSQCL
ncbi:hypothetical protein DXG03_005223, partial [Asterophora parasitica]